MLTRAIFESAAKREKERLVESIFRATQVGPEVRKSSSSGWNFATRLLPFVKPGPRAVFVEVMFDWLIETHEIFRTAIFFNQRKREGNQRSVFVKKFRTMAFTVSV